MKQITIYDLLPLLKKGFVAYDGNGWVWFDKMPVFVEDDDEDCWMVGVDGGNACNLSARGCPFNIKPFDKAWEDSLIKVEHKEEDAFLMVDKSTGPEWYKNGKRIK